MPGRGPQTFKKRQKEQERRERQQEKFAKRLQRKDQPQSSEPDNDFSDYLDDPLSESNPAVPRTGKPATN